MLVCDMALSLLRLGHRQKGKTLQGTETPGTVSSNNSELVCVSCLEFGNEKRIS